MRGFDAGLAVAVFPVVGLLTAEVVFFSSLFGLLAMVCTSTGLSFGPALWQAASLPLPYSQRSQEPCPIPLGPRNRSVDISGFLVKTGSS